MGIINRLFGSDESKIKETLEDLNSVKGNAKKNSARLDSFIENAYMSGKSRDEILAIFSEDADSKHFTKEHFTYRVDAQLAKTSLDKLDALIDTGENKEAFVQVANDIKTLNIDLNDERFEKLQQALGTEKLASIGFSNNVNNPDTVINNKLSEIATLEDSLSEVGGGHQGKAEKSSITKDINEQKADIAAIYTANADKLSEETKAALNKVGMNDDKIASIVKDEATASADTGISNPLIQPANAAEAPNKAAAPQEETVAADPEKTAVTKISFQPHDRGTGVGYAGDSLKEVQQFLLDKGFFQENATAEQEVDGDFGGRTRDAVKKFQESAGVTADGIIGKDTIAAMNTVLAKEQALEATKGTEATPTPEGDAVAPTQGNKKEQPKQAAGR